jgi:Protein of unknown function (DUF1631)
MTAVNPTLVALVDHVLADLPNISRQVLESTGHALQSNSRNFALKDAWSRRRARFPMEFESELRPLLATLRRGESGQRAHSGGIEGLSLVDENQALRDVAIAHTVELIADSCRQELFQLGNFFGALNRNTPHGRDPNALRPALFATALVNSLAGGDLNAEHHYALTRVAAPGLVHALQPVYRRLADQLRDANLTPLVSSDLSRLRPRKADGPNSLTGGLTGVSDWHARAQSVSSQRQPARAASGSGASPALLDRLYERILSDPNLTAPVKAQLARLQVAVVRLSRDDPSLLRRDDHPTWRLINAVAAYASGLTTTGDSRLTAFLQFLDAQTKDLVDSAQLSSAGFEAVLRAVDAFIAKQARERTEPSRAALAVLERELQRTEWLKVLRSQLDEQGRKTKLDRSARTFLVGPWAQMVVETMVQEGHDSPPAERLLQVVDDLIESLRPRRSTTDRERLRLSLPALVGRVEQALGGVAVGEAKRKTLMLELMQLHRAVLHASLTPQKPEADGSTEVEAAPSEFQVSRYVEERDSAYASVWAHADVNRAALPTLPLPLPGTAAGRAEQQLQLWLDQLRVGGWFHLFVGGGWLTAQLVWISGARSYFFFVGQDADQRHSLTEGALTQLYHNGLVMYLEQEGLVERAVNTLMQDLDD